MPDFSIEKEIMSKGFTSVCGIDEAGRGPLCGPVVAAACILPIDIEIPKLNDSKKLNAKSRDILYDLIIQNAISYSIAQASVEEIDALNILEATLLAMRRAVNGLCIPADYLLVDGNIYRDFSLPGQCVIGGDAKSSSIAAASILAKVTRDRWCAEIDSEYPQYGIAAHKGYGTASHMKALREFGPTPIHRKKFIRFLDN